MNIFNLFLQNSNEQEYKQEDPIDLLDLDKNIIEILKRENIKTIGKLNYYKNKRFGIIKGLNSKQIREILEIKNKIRPYFSTSETSSFKKEDTSNIEHIGYTVPLNISLEDRIESLRLPTRLENILVHNDIKTVGRLYRFSNSSLKKIRSIGVRNLSLIYKVKQQLKSVIEDDGNSVYLPSPIFFPKPPSVMQYDFDINDIDGFLESFLGGKTRDILTRRYGLSTGERETLEEIAKSYDLTRERIRQLQVKGILRLKKSPQALINEFNSITESVFTQQSILLSDEEVDGVFQVKYPFLKYDGSSIFDLFSDVGLVDSYDVAGLYFYTTVNNLKLGSTKTFNLKIISKLVTDILKSSKDSLSIEEIVSSIGIKFRKKIIPNELFVLVGELCKKDPRIEQPTKSKFRMYSHGINRKAMWVSIIKDELEKAGMPLHFTEIAERVNGAMIGNERRLDVRRAHSILIDSPIFAHCGTRGTYGLTNWGYRKETTLGLCKEYIGRAGLPVHFEQIYSYIARYKDSSVVSIRALLDNSGLFNAEGNGFYTAKKA